MMVRQLKRSCLVLVCTLVLANCAQLADDNPLLGGWQATESSGDLWYRKLAFSEEHIYAEDLRGRLLRFNVRGYDIAGDRVQVRTNFGETYVFERISRDLICFERFHRQKSEALAIDPRPDVRDRHCYVRAQPA